MLDVLLGQAVQPVELSLDDKVCDVADLKSLPDAFVFDPMLFNLVNVDSQDSSHAPVVEDEE